MQIRKTVEADIPQVLRIYEAARRYMRSEGNVHQWSDSYPAEANVRADIECGGSYVCLADDGSVAATFFFRLGDDPTYSVIYDGAWPDNSHYGVVHRIASDGRIKHLLHRVLDFCFTLTPTIRIDTYCDNLTMRRGLESFGFQYCGIIHTALGAERLAYQKSTIEWQTKTWEQLTKDELYAILKLRSEVFIVEQDCVYQDLDEKDSHCWHIMGREQGRLSAYMRVIPLGVESDTEGSIGRIIVAPHRRGTGLGHDLVDRGIALYNEVVGAQHPIVIHAQSQLEKFYSQHGFVATSEPFMFEGLPHTIMMLSQ